MKTVILTVALAAFGASASAAGSAYVIQFNGFSVTINADRIYGTNKDADTLAKRICASVEKNAEHQRSTEAEAGRMIIYYVCI